MMHPRKGEFFFQPCPLYVPEPDPPQSPAARRSFDENSLSELAESIRRYGTPPAPTVRRQGQAMSWWPENDACGRRHGGTAGGAVSGGAGRGGGLGALALMENLQRRDLIAGGGGSPCPGSSPAMGSVRGDRSPSGPLPAGGGQQAAGGRTPCGKFLQENGLTERHARRCRGWGRRSSSWRRRRILPAQDECGRRRGSHRDLLHRQQVTPPKGRLPHHRHDVRLFLNSVDRGSHLMRQAGVNADWGRQDTDEEILLTIRIPKRVRT